MYSILTFVWVLLSVVFIDNNDKLINVISIIAINFLMLVYAELLLI